MFSACNVQPKLQYSPIKLGIQKLGSEFNVNLLFSQVICCKNATRDPTMPVGINFGRIWANLVWRHFCLFIKVFNIVFLSLINLKVTIIFHCIANTQHSLSKGKDTSILFGICKLTAKPQASKDNTQQRRQKCRHTSHRPYTATYNVNIQAFQKCRHPNYSFPSSLGTNFPPHTTQVFLQRLCIILAATVRYIGVLQSSGVATSRFSTLFI